VTPERSPSTPDVQLLKLHQRRTHLDRVIRLLEEIQVLQLNRTPELTAFISKQKSARLA
jgi:hypothetical protein